MTITAPESISPTGPIRGNEKFRRLLGASAVSMLGSHVTTIAFPLLVLRLTGSAFTAGCAVFATTAPSMLAYIPAGVLVDRWSPRRVMLLSDLGRGLVIGMVALNLALGKPRVAVLMAVAVIDGTLAVFSELAERCYVGSLVGRDQVPSALVRTEARTHIVLVAGRPLGGLLFGICPIFPFLADFFSFVYSVTALFGIKDTNSTRRVVIPSCAPTRRNSLASDITQGLRWMYQDKLVPMGIISSSFGTLTFQALIVIFLGYAHSRLLPSFTIGMLLAASGVGGALGSLVASRLLPRIGYWIPIQTGISFFGFSFLLLPVGRQFLSIAIIMAILGLTGAVGNIALDTHVMQNADREMLARVTSVGQLVSFAAYSIGPITGGILTQEFGNQRAMSFLFILTLVPLMLSIFTILALQASTRQGNSHVRPKAVLDSCDSHAEDGDACFRYGETGMEKSDLFVMEGTGMSKAERLEGHRNSAPPLRLLAGATIAALSMITKRTDR